MSAKKYTYSQQRMPAGEYNDPTLRAGRFRPLSIGDQHTIDAMSQFAYITVPGRFKWSTDQRLQAYGMVKELGINPRALYHRYGMMGELVERMPEEFDFQRLKHRFVAKMNPSTNKVNVFFRG